MKKIPREIAELIKVGRVIINQEGEATNFKAAEDLGATVDVLFLRGDGYALGASHGLRSKAYSMWRDEWESFYDLESQKHRPIEEFRRFYAERRTR